MSVVDNKLLLAGDDGGYQISRSVRLRKSASAYLNRTPISASNRTTWTWSAWVKRGAITDSMQVFHAGTSGSSTCFLEFSNDGSNGDSLVFTDYQGSYNAQIKTTALYRDVSAWYHVVLAVDTTQATYSNRVKIYVNGTQVTSFISSTYPSLNATLLINSAVEHAIGRWYSGATRYFDGYLTEINFIDGQALTPSSFGENDVITGVWKPKRYAGTYGTNGFYLNFSDNSAATAAAIGKDSSGNGNNWTPNNISVTAGATYDSMLDTPTPYADGGNGRGNYAVLNPLDKDSGNTVADGNLKVTTSSSGQGFQRGSVFVNSGKWYWEVTVTDATGNSAIGIAGQSTVANTTNYIGATSDSYGYIATNGNKYNNSSSSAYGATYTTGNVIGVALDMDAGTLVFYKDNTSQGTAYTGLSGYFAPAVSDVSNTLSSVFNANFGQRPFAYTPPTGFKALNTQNLPDATITKGSKHFDVSTWTGNGASRSITGLNFQPDFVWPKARSAAIGHLQFDSVRGATKYLQSASTAAEGTGADSLTAFNTDGFSLGADTSTTGVNQNGTTYTGWAWKAGGTAVSNTSGSITSSVSANASAGFSVVTYTTAGANGTVGHGLGVAPKMVIVKSRNNTSGWSVYHSSVGNTGALNLQATTATSTSIDWWSNTSPTSTVFSFGGNLNFSGWTWVAYCFSEVAGYSKFGSYTGNGSTDGPFVYLGFRPKWVMVKCSDNAGLSWFILDEVRNTYNVCDARLFPDQSAAETTGQTNLDILSNGFKVRTSGTSTNGSGYNYVYAAFAENPFKNSLAR